MADNTARIAAIRAILSSGVTSSTVDGTTIVYDLESLRKELHVLCAEDNTQNIRRPRISSVNLSGLR
jgi:hypothetical protein